VTAPPGPARPARLAAFVLLGVAVVAVGLGVFSLTGNGQPTANTGHPPVTATTTAAPASTTTHPASSAPGATTTAPTTSYPSGQTTTVAPPPGAATTTAPPASPYAGVPVIALNNSTIKNLAETAGSDFRAAGFDVAQTGNYAYTTIPASTVYYTPSIAGQQVVAQALAQQFGMQLAVRTPDFAGYPPGVVAVVTKDFNGAVNGGK
jgi:LytR cell envelope-related transcriptional attenuator